MNLISNLDVAVSVAASSARMWRGTDRFRPARRQPEKTLELYEFEGCPYCRLVREALTELDLDAMIYPCPKGGSRYRPVVEKRGGKAQFPWLVDPNTGVEMYESADIIRYLYATYADRSVPGNPLRRGFDVATSSLASASRGTRGVRARPAKVPEEPLELFSFESSPYSRRVRELLCELQIHYLLRNTGKAYWREMGPPAVRKRCFRELEVKGRNRIRLYERTGRLQVPYLIDPNTGAEMFESEDIRRYLLDTYAA